MRVIEHRNYSAHHELADIKSGQVAHAQPPDTPAAAWPNKT